MCHAWAHYVHVVCTSGHPLRQCSKQPIIYSTLISTHVNPHQSSHAQGDCCGSHTASWQNIRSEHEKTLLGMIRTCHQTRRAPPERAATSSAFKTDQGAQREKVSRRGAGRPRLCPLRSAGSPRPTVRIESGAGCTAENAPTAVRDGARDGGDGARSKAPPCRRDVWRARSPAASPTTRGRPARRASLAQPRVSTQRSSTVVPDQRSQNSLSERACKNGTEERKRRALRVGLFSFRLSPSPAPADGSARRRGAASRTPARGRNGDGGGTGAASTRQRVSLETFSRPISTHCLATFG